ncbi:MAG: transporter substrate-binding domain-containing protein, partial [Synergistaceae bacterium]|nr:transporter substrate-binding domain-containing protein [Synergistaceae bacterium]
MKKALCIILLVLVFAGAAYAEKVGVLSRLDIPAEVFRPDITRDIISKFVRTTISHHLKPGDVEFKVYDSMVAMMMALNAGEIDAIQLPDCVAEYVLRENPKTDARAFLLLNGWMYLVMGLKEGNEALRDKISAAIADMNKDGTTSLLIRYHVQGPEAREPMPVEFAKYDDAETLKVVVTGDFPPIDYVDAGGQAAGYNTAMLAEIGRRLHMNVQLVYTDAASRAAALMSGKADVVFWFKLHSGQAEQFDIPEGIITTAPYYG